MSTIKFSTSSTSLQAYMERLKRQGFLPEQDGNKQDALQSKLNSVDETSLPFPLPENGKPRGCWKQLFGQGYHKNNYASLSENNDPAEAEQTRRLKL